VALRRAGGCRFCTAMADLCLATIRDINSFTDSLSTHLHRRTWRSDLVALDDSLTRRQLALQADVTPSDVFTNEPLRLMGKRATRQEVTVFITTVIGGNDRPALPRGRMLELPGRGATFVREMNGPVGAPVVMLLHGWSATADLNWHPSYAPLARHFRVIAIDHRGHGRGLRSDDPFRLEHCADDVAAVATQLGVERMIAVGYSMGGPIAQLLWKRHRSLVDGLVMCSTSATFGSTPRLRALFGVVAGLRASRAIGPVGSVANSALGVVSKWNNVRGGSPWGVQQLAGHDWKQLIEAGHQIGRYDASSWIGSVSVPTAVVATTDDEVVPVADQLALARSIPASTLRTLPGGHHGCVTAPQRFVPALVDACCEIAARVGTLNRHNMMPSPATLVA
jgi:3-oxoadipate enol-lactonase